MRALVTRPKADAEGVAQELRARGIDVQIEPLLEIVPFPGVTIDLDGVQALLASSANGVRSLAAATARRDLPLLAVGDATARCAREHGFLSVESAGGDVHSLAALVRRRLDPASGTLLHAAGTDVAGDLGQDLARSGYHLRRVKLYEARKASHLSAEAVSALREERVDLALFFSPRTAATFVTLVVQVELQDACRSIAAICLSAAVARELEALPWRSLRVAAKPDQRSLLAALDEECQSD
ncbi:uroporphyrinogen-III synthase [Telmatospirillum sp. J64-1]|uniref:uroporphyrinogen-III synthase n=1 Tax=Telmatospirillum sp. J64-1 TaxID=2502183 RepID=UPI00115CDF62|nr:uroporphyrinogen-III synthase [Telmatospirillum sp. J64-1]